jgi:hypothetical protein
MDPCVVNYASPRSRIGEFSGHSSAQDTTARRGIPGAPPRKESPVTEVARPTGKVHGLPAEWREAVARVWNTHFALD